MITLHFNPAPAEIPEGDSRAWMDRIANCARSCAATMETRKIRSNEVPIVIGALVVALADHTELPLERVLGMISTSARGLVVATPETLTEVAS